jgi:hypothetical protein
LKTSFQARSNPEASYHRKRIGGFQPIKTELFANKTYYWCSCGYAQHQVKFLDGFSFSLNELFF